MANPIFRRIYVWCCRIHCFICIPFWIRNLLWNFIHFIYTYIYIFFRFFSLLTHFILERSKTNKSVSRKKVMPCTHMRAHIYTPNEKIHFNVGSKAFKLKVLFVSASFFFVVCISFWALTESHIKISNTIQDTHIKNEHQKNILENEMPK